MTTHSTAEAQRKAAKVAAAAQLLSFATVVGSNFGILQRLLTDDPARTAGNILAHETLFRVGLMGFVLYSIGVVVQSAALYVVLRPVDQNLTLLSFLGRLIHGFTWLVVTLNLFTALRLLSRPEYAGVLPPGQLPVLARLYLSGFDQYYVGLLFWSLGATIGAYVWLKSGFIPRSLAVFGILASGWCVACTAALLIRPTFSNVVNLWAFDTPMALFEIALSVLLLVRGLRSEGP